MSDIESAIARLEEEQCTDPTCDGCQSRRTVIAAARAMDQHREWCLAALNDLTDTQKQLAAERKAHQDELDSQRATTQSVRKDWVATCKLLADERVAHAADVSKLAGEIADERRAREQAEARAAQEAEGRFQAEARAERLEAALRKYGEHYEGCHGGHRCHCGLSAALGEKP